MRRLTFWQAVFLLVGTQIGAGILGLPKVVSTLGFFWGSVAIALAGTTTLLTAIFLLEALYLTNPHYHLFELFRHYLGRWGVLFTLAILYSGYGALTAYVSGIADILSNFGVPPLISALLFWATFSVVVFLGIRASGQTETALNILMLLLFLIIVLWSLPFSSAYHHPFSLSPFLYAFSVAVFAFFGHVVIPEIAREMGRFRAFFAVLTAFLITTFVYLVFSLTIAGVTKDRTTDIATEGLIRVLGSAFAPFAYAFPLLTITTSFIGVGLAQRDILREMLGNKVLAWAAALLPPLLLYLFGLRGFVNVIFLSSLGLLLAGGILPPIVFYLARKKQGRVVYPVDARLAPLLSMFFLFVLAYVLATAF